MDIPQVLEMLRPNEDWGPLANSGNTYAQLAATWRGTSPVPTLQEMQAAWSTLQAEAPAKERAKKRGDAKSLLDASDPDRVMIRAVLRVVFASVAEVRAKVGLPARSWQQLLAAVRAEIDAGNADV